MIRVMCDTADDTDEKTDSTGNAEDTGDTAVHKGYKVPLRDMVAFTSRGASQVEKGEQRRPNDTHDLLLLYASYDWNVCDPTICVWLLH